MNIHDLIRQIPEVSEDEAWRSIQSIKVIPHHVMILSCHLSKPFFIEVILKRTGKILINDRECTFDEFLCELKKEIYREDETMIPKITMAERITFLHSPPPEMDIPIFNPVSKTWFDAET